MVAKNDQYQYKSIPDAFKKMYAQNGITGMYKGSSHFLVNYVLSYSILMVIYETYMDLKKAKHGLEKFKRNENRYVVEAALLGGFLSGLLMNSFECIVVLRMADQEANKSIIEIYKEQGRKLFTKGLGTRIIMTQGYTLLHFNMLFHLGRMFDCDLLDKKDEEFLENLPEI